MRQVIKPAKKKQKRVKNRKTVIMRRKRQNLRMTKKIQKKLLKIKILL